MLLTELHPAWVLKDGERVGFVFDCPHCRKVRLTCYRVGLGWNEQVELLEKNGIEVFPPSGLVNLVGCKEGYAWNFDPNQDFAQLSVTPSIDASKAGSWHGFITNGAIQ